MEITIKSMVQKWKERTKDHVKVENIARGGRGEGRRWWDRA